MNKKKICFVSDQPGEPGPGGEGCTGQWSGGADQQAGHADQTAGGQAGWTGQYAVQCRTHSARHLLPSTLLSIQKNLKISCGYIEKRKRNPAGRARGDFHVLLVVWILNSQNEVQGWIKKRSGQVRSECLTCTIRASCCSACLSRAQVLAFAGSSVRERKIKKGGWCFS